MYVSEPPCGDSSMLEKTTVAKDNTEHQVKWTGAKPLTFKNAPENGT